GILILGLGLSATSGQTQMPAGPTAKPAAPARPAPASSHTATTPAADQNALVKRYCAGCHSDRGKAGGLTLTSFDVAAAVEHAEVTEKMIRMLQPRSPPPPGPPRP